MSRIWLVKKPRRKLYLQRVGLFLPPPSPVLANIHVVPRVCFTPERTLTSTDTSVHAAMRCTHNVGLPIPVQCWASAAAHCCLNAGQSYSYAILTPFSWKIDFIFIFLGPIKFSLPECVSYLGERGVLCGGNGSHFCTPVLMNMCNITFQILRLSIFVFNKCSEKKYSRLYLWLRA